MAAVEEPKKGAGDQSACQEKKTILSAAANWEKNVCNVWGVHYRGAKILRKQHRENNGCEAERK